MIQLTAVLKNSARVASIMPFIGIPIRAYRIMSMRPRDDEGDRFPYPETGDSVNTLIPVSGGHLLTEISSMLEVKSECLHILLFLSIIFLYPSNFAVLFI
jgi:hypothetical protein